MLVRNEKDLRVAYETVKLIEESISEKSVKLLPNISNVLREYKKDIRNYYKRQKEGLNTSLVKDYGIDGYIEKIELPFMFSKDEAKRYVESNIVMEYYPSQYDCTGQCFTSWYRIFKNSKNRYICYHRLSVDC